jgi:hypothetical protein
MKTIKHVIVALVLSAFTIHAATNPIVNQVVQVTKDAAVAAVNSETVQVAKTNLNSVMIDILSGVRDAGKEIYGASKDAIRSSVNFAQEQAPLVVKEFLRWHMARAVLYAIGFFIPSYFILYFARKLYKYAKEQDSGDAYGVSAILSAIGLAFFIFGVGSQLMTVTKIAIAPKVYIIEYVVDTIQGDHRTPQTR